MISPCCQGADDAADALVSEGASPGGGGGLPLGTKTKFHDFLYIYINVSSWCVIMTYQEDHVVELVASADNPKVDSHPTLVEASLDIRKVGKHQNLEDLEPNINVYIRIINDIIYLRQYKNIITTIGTFPIGTPETGGIG